jgi:hypothetical protein
MPAPNRAFLRPRDAHEDGRPAVSTVGADTSHGWPRLLSRKGAAAYLSCSTAEIDRLVAVGELGVVRLPAVRHTNGTATVGTNRRVFLDRVELDALCVRCRERVGR